MIGRVCIHNPTHQNGPILDFTNRMLSKHTLLQSALYLGRPNFSITQMKTKVCFNYKVYMFALEFVTCGVELLRGHCTDIPADQGSWKRICAICSF